MMSRTTRWAVWIVLAGAVNITAVAPSALAQDQGAAAPARKSGSGTVKSINGSTLVVKPDSGADITVTLQDNTKIVRIAPGQTDLKSATPLQLKDLQVGDRTLVRGAPGTATDSITATLVVVIKGTDVAQKQQQELQDWQRRGVGGIVSAIDAAGGTITVAATPTINYSVKTSKDTGFLRYAPNSIQFSDAQKGTFDQIKVGDQLRARGNRSADGKEVAAEEVISGTFRNIAGTITAIDAGGNSVTVKDILAKKTVVVKLTGESQMRKLPPQMAMGIAAFLKGSAGGPGGGNAPSGGSASAVPANGGGSASTGPPSGPGGRAGGGARDFQQMVNRLPAVTLADLQKEDAVMIVSTPGTGGTEVTAITLLGGVEPILTAAPNGMGAAALLSGWNLSAPGGGEGGGPQ